jgi:hypothetical protein
MSKYEVLRLNGCDISEYIELPDYPHCETHDLASVEMSFVKSSIPFETNNILYNWAAPGDCARLNAEVANGKGFNGWPLENCLLTGKFAGVRPNAVVQDNPINRFDVVESTLPAADDTSRVVSQSTLSQGSVSVKKRPVDSSMSIASSSAGPNDSLVQRSRLLKGKRDDQSVTQLRSSRSPKRSKRKRDDIIDDDGDDEDVENESENENDDEDEDEEEEEDVEDVEDDNDDTTDTSKSTKRGKKGRGNGNGRSITDDDGIDANDDIVQTNSVKNSKRGRGTSANTSTRSGKRQKQRKREKAQKKRQREQEREDEIDENDPTATPVDMDTVFRFATQPPTPLPSVSPTVLPSVSPSLGEEDT